MPANEGNGLSEIYVHNNPSALNPSIPGLDIILSDYPIGTAIERAPLLCNRRINSISELAERYHQVLDQIIEARNSRDDDTYIALLMTNRASGLINISDSTVNVRQAINNLKNLYKTAKYYYRLENEHIDSAHVMSIISNEFYKDIKQVIKNTRFLRLKNWFKSLGTLKNSFQADFGEEVVLHYDAKRPYLA